ncbi:MAG: hypothetical protein IKL10_03675 [Clostridia bacterium]|nr:hypothetical protein [Clostridia bacterium]
MKKLFSIIISLILLLLLSTSAFAWSVPGDLYSDDNVTIYFAEVINMYPSFNKVSVIPTKIIKGDVPLGQLKIADTSHQILIPGNTYIFASFNDDVNNYVFFPDSYDTDTLKLSDKTDIDNDIEIPINSGKYKESDNKRIDKINQELKTVGQPVTLSEALGLQKNAENTVKIENYYDIPYDEFYSVCSTITAYPVDSRSTKSQLRQMTIYTEDITFGITSDAKILMNSHTTYADYTVSAKDRDKLLSLLPEEELELPFIYKGTVLLIIKIISLLAFIAIIFSLLKLRRKKHNK